MQTTARPRFRQDLLAEVIEEGGQKFIDVADEGGNAIFRFFEVEYAIACGMDGQRDVAGIVKWAQDELGLSASAKEIQSVIDTLSGLAFLGDDQLVDTAAAKVATQTPAAQAQPASAGAASHAPANAAAAVQASIKSPAAAKNDDLAPGIVTAKSAQAPATRGLDIELGSSGSSAPAAQAKESPVADITLGAPGVAQTKQPPKIPVEDVALGAPGVGAAQAKKKGDDLAMDLSSEMSVGKGDVQAAVRQSKVMTAVDVPKELVEAEAKPAQKAKADPTPAKGEKKPEPKKEEPKKEEPKKAEAKKEEPKKAEAKKEEPKKAEAKKEEPKKAEAKKEEPKKAETKKAEPAKKPAPDKAPVPAAPAAGVSPALIVTLIVVIVAAGAFLAYKFVFAKDAATPKTPPAAAKPPEPPPPATATAKIVLETPAAMEVKAGVAGAIETIQPAGTDVKAGDTIATLAGAKPLETQLAAIDKQIEQLKAPVTAAEAKLAEEQAKPDNGPAATAAQKRVDDLKKPITAKETERKAKQEAIDKLAIKSNADGKLAAPGETELKAGDRITADQVVVKVAAPAVATANFKVPAGIKLGDSLALKAGDKSVNCKITDSQNESVKVACPADSGLADGADVVVTFPAAK